MYIAIDNSYYYYDRTIGFVHETQITNPSLYEGLQEFKETPLNPKNKYFTSVHILWAAFNLPKDTVIWDYREEKYTMRYQLFEGTNYFTGVIHNGRDK